jgi:hypothetical protein
VSPDNRRLGFLDFAGAREDDFDGWTVWSSRTAGRSHLAAEIEGGHGNGGKAFMVRGSDREAYMLSVVDGKASKMGFKNDAPHLRYQAGWFNDTKSRPIKSLPVDDIDLALDRELQLFGTSLKALPPEAQKVFKERKAFTIVHIDGVKDWTGKSRSAVETLVRRLPHDLADHPQMALTIELCTVWVMRGTEYLHQGPLQVVYPDPHPDMPEVEKITIPDKLEDPESGETIDTGSGEKYLEIRSARQNLRLANKTALNAIRVRNERNPVAIWPTPELVQMSTSVHLYGTLRVPALVKDHLAGSDRVQLAETSLVLALRKWTADTLTERAKKLQQVQSSRDRKEDREKANEALRRLREEMVKHLQPQQADVTGTGKGKGKPQRQFGSIVHEIQLERSDALLRIPTGTKVPVVYKCYEIDGEQKLPVRKPNVQFVASESGIVAFESDGTVKALSAGVCTLYIQNQSGTVRSNTITVEAIDVTSLELNAPDRNLKQGERTQVGITAYDGQGKQLENLVFEASVDEPEIASIGRSGVLTAGGVEGGATIRVKYSSEGEKTAVIFVGPERDEREPPKAGGIPLILLCGDEAPGHEDLPPDQRTLSPSVGEPTIIDTDPRWENEVIWINHHSVESQKVRSSKTQYGVTGLDTQLFYQFLALKCFEILKRLKMKQELEDQTVGAVAFLDEMSRAEIETAAFLDAAFPLIERLLSERREGRGEAA